MTLHCTSARNTLNAPGEGLIRTASGLFRPCGRLRYAAASKFASKANLSNGVLILIPPSAINKKGSDPQGFPPAKPYP